MKSSKTNGDDMRRAWVAVSKERQALRETQEKLNYFLWSTEISYGHFLHNAETEFAPLNRKAHEAFGHLKTEAWIPNRQGRVKYQKDVEGAISDVRENTTYIYRTVIVNFVSAFEQYLKHRVGALRVARRPLDRSWGPYYITLSHHRFRNSQFPLHPSSLLRADICRALRNDIVHPGKVDWLSDWRAGASDYLRNPRCTWSRNDVEKAAKAVLTNARDQRAMAQAAGRNPPIEFFYMLFTFANLDTLAFEIERALIPIGDLPPGRIDRVRSDIRRDDIIVGDC